MSKGEVVRELSEQLECSTSSAAAVSGEAGAIRKIVGPSKEKRIREAFQAWDKDSKGFLNKHELNCAFLQLFGCKPLGGQVSEDEGEDENEEGGDGGGGGGSFSLPYHKFEAKAREKFYLQDRDEEIRYAFKAFDTKGLGYISRSACLETFKKHATFAPAHVVELLFDEVDIDRDGKVTYRDFVKVWKSADAKAFSSESMSEYALNMNRDFLWR